MKLVAGGYQKTAVSIVGFLFMTITWGKEATKFERWWAVGQIFINSWLKSPFKVVFDHTDIQSFFILEMIIKATRMYFGNFFQLLQWAGIKSPGPEEFKGITDHLLSIEWGSSSHRRFVFLQISNPIPNWLIWFQKLRYCRLVEQFTRHNRVTCWVNF